MTTNFRESSMETCFFKSLIIENPWELRLFILTKAMELGEEH